MKIQRVFAYGTVVRHGERGATAVEYGMLVALIAAVIISTVVLVGPIVNDLFEAVQWW